MTEPDLLRPSRDGDQFHYIWAARQSLRLLDKRSGLHSLVVEGVDPSELPPLPESETFTADGSDPEDDTDTGHEVIDLAEYWGSSDISQTERVVYRQFKHSTRSGEKPWTLSFLSKTLLGFARKYRLLQANHPETLGRVQFEFISNRPPAQSAISALNDLRAGTHSPSTRGIRERLLQIITAEDIEALSRLLVVDDRAPSLLKLRHLLDLEVADLLPGAPAEQALLLREMISSRATSVAGDNPAVLRSDVLAALKTTEDQLLPVPNLIEPPARPVERRQFAEIAARIQDFPAAPTLVHGPGGVGKSALTGALGRHMPGGSITIVIDCFGNGSYRRPSAPRHRSKHGYVQLVNELAGRALCDPLIPSATADDADYALAFIHKLTKAAEALATTTPGALLTIAIDAADNAAMIADEMGEHTFVRGLVRESFPKNVRLVLTCRTERIDLLGLPANHQDIPLQGFDLNETFVHLRHTYPEVSAADASEFHARTSHNPRVQTAVLDATADLHEALAWLAPSPSTPGQALDSLIERQVGDIRARQPSSAHEIDAICVGLAALRPMIPVRVLAELANVHPSVVLSFISDLGRPLLVDGNTVQFRDEPTETWFRDRYRPVGGELDAFIERIAPIADEDAYVATSLPALLFEANRFEDLVKLALSDERLPDNALPGTQRNEIQRREIAQQRTQFALSAALRVDRDFEGAQLALRLAALTAGRTRRLDLIRENTDLAARFLDPTVLEHLIATRSLTAGWPNSNLAIEGALLAGAPGQTDQARNRLRSATSWMYAWTRQTRSDDSEAGLGDLDILQVSWGLLNTDGPAACVQFIRSWRPRTLAFDVGVDIVRRLLDAGRLIECADFARVAKGPHLKLAVAHACAERNVELDADVVKHLLPPLLKKRKIDRLSSHTDFQRSGSGAPVHGGLTAAIWLTSRAVVLEIMTATRAAEILRAFVPKNLGRLTGAWYDQDIWQPILGLALCARFEGRDLDPVEIQGPSIGEARERERFESSQDLRVYQANVEPLTSWAVAWLDLLMNPTSDSIGSFRKRSAAFLQEAPPEWRTERVDKTKINNVFLIIGCALARFPGIVDQTVLLAFQAQNNDIITRQSLTNFIRQIASSPGNHGLASELARRCHEDAANAREEAGEIASGFVQLARATFQLSVDEALVHFQAAIDVTNAIGDDAWVRWETFLDIAGHSGCGDQEQPGRAYRLCQIAESLEPFLGDYLSHTEALSVAARLSLPEALAAGSRWRDRRVSPIGSLANAIITDPALLLNDDPATALALLPLGDRYPDHSSLASALASSPNDATGAIVAYLRFRRPQQLSTSSLEELLKGSGVSRASIELIDPSLLWTSASDAGSHTPNVEPRPSREDAYAEFDLVTADGWAAALNRFGHGHSREDFFHYVAATVGLSPDLLRAFNACPTTSYWDLSHLLGLLEGRLLSMGTRAVLDEVLVTQFSRFAPDILLVSYRTPDFTNARSLTGRNTDYEHIASRALAAQETFTAEQAYALAKHLGRRLTNDKALQLFDTAASYFDDVAPLDALDGHQALGMTEGWGPEEAVAAVFWTALGDPAVKTRWQAAHSVYMALVLGQTGVVSRMLELASGRIWPGQFLDDRLDFYERHAHQWLLFAISRATVDQAGLATASLFEGLLQRTLSGTPHAVNTPLARDSLLRLHAAGLIRFTSAGKKRIEQTGRPIGSKRRDWSEGLEEVSSLNEIVSERWVSGLTVETPKNQETRVEVSPSTDDEVPGDDRFRFFFDFRDYWCRPLGDAFGMSERSIERLVTEVLIDRWAVPSRGRPEDDTRHTLRLYPQNAYPHKSEWPEEEDLDFYLAVQGLCDVAGILLEHRPVVQQYDEDEETGESEYTRFIQWHMPSRADGRWLSDRRDPAPVYARLDLHDPADPRTGARDPHWIYGITSPRFHQELCPSPERVVVWGGRTVRDYSRRETVGVHSALVSPETARSLLKALQTSPDKHAYRIPDVEDKAFTSTVTGFELTGWIERRGVPYGRDAQDPYARSVVYPPCRPSDAIPLIKALAPDPDLRLWRDGESVVIEQTSWDDFASESAALGSSGDALVANRYWLAGMLEELKRWLIVEVEIKRSSDDAAFRSSNDVDDEDQLRYLPPYTKYFLIDTMGEIHEF